MRLRANESLFLIVDVQARLAPAIPDVERVIDRTNLLLGAADGLDVPVVVTEQYPKGLGGTDPRLILPAAAETYTKTAFSAAAEPGFLAALWAKDRRQIVLAGTEAHVCVLQTGLGLIEAGFAVHLVADATASRVAESRDLALHRLRAAGGVVVNAEMVVFEWLERADTDAFRELIPAIKGG